MITKYQWNKYCRHVKYLCDEYDVSIHGNIVTSVIISEYSNHIIRCENKLTKIVTLYEHPFSLLERKSLKEVYYLTKVKTKPSAMINTSLDKALLLLKGYSYREDIPNIL